MQQSLPKDIGPIFPKTLTTHYGSKSLGYVKDTQVREILRIHPELYEYLVIENRLGVEEMVCACFNENSVLLKITTLGGRQIIIEKIEEPDYYLETH